MSSQTKKSRASTAAHSEHSSPSKRSARNADRYKHLLSQFGLCAAAAFSGLMLFASFQPTGLWWAAPLGMALFFAIVTRQGVPVILAAWLQGLTLYALMLPWVGEFVGAYAWIALAIVQSLYSLLFGWGLTRLLPLAAPVRGSRGEPRPILFTVLVSAWFVATEYLRSSWPFGGFPWGRLAWGQVGGPLSGLIQVAGPATVSFAVVASGFLLYLVFRWLYARVRQGMGFDAVPSTPPVQGRLALGALAGIAVMSLIGGGFIRTNTTEGEGAEGTGHSSTSSVRVAAVQGNVPRLGLDFNAQRRAVLENHARATHELAERVSQGKAEQPEIVIWPENASDINPFVNADAAEILDEATRAIGAPILVGTVTPEHNRMVVWDEDGPGDTHDKRFLQPFGEYMPFRDLLRRIIPLVDRAGDFQPGVDNGVVAMAPARGGGSSAGESGRNPVLIGLATCYEVAFDGAYRDAVAGGAELLSTPTNNATFGFTDMTYQQLAMSRMRAIEYDRAVVIAATSGVSAIVRPDGTVDSSTRIFTRDILEAELPLIDRKTLSAVAGPWGEWILAGIGAVAVLLLLVWNPRQVKPATTTGRARKGR